MRKLSHQDGSWSDLIAEWKAACEAYDQDLNDYLPEAMALLDRECAATEGDNLNGVFASLSEGGSYQAICFVNCSPIPKFVGPVQRVRHILLSPHADFGDFNEAQYGDLLGRVFDDIISASDHVFGCRHIKIHFRSPADVALFKKVKTNLQNSAHFSSVEFIGAWLILTKR